jgi:hypothetical protein
VRAVAGVGAGAAMGAETMGAETMGSGVGSAGGVSVAVASGVTSGVGVGLGDGSWARPTPTASMAATKAPAMRTDSFMGARRKYSEM